jgi:hypothetical protein
MHKRAHELTRYLSVLRRQIAITILYRRLCRMEHVVALSMSPIAQRARVPPSAVRRTWRLPNSTDMFVGQHGLNDGDTRRRLTKSTPSLAHRT